jgi:hypothetical protein
MKNTLIELEALMNKFAAKITKQFGCGDPLDGDQVFELASLFNVLLDYNNGNITHEEMDAEVNGMLDRGNLPINIMKKRGNKNA